MRCRRSSSHSVTARRSRASSASRASTGSAWRQARRAQSWDLASPSSMRSRWMIGPRGASARAEACIMPSRASSQSWAWRITRKPQRAWWLASRIHSTAVARRGGPPLPVARLLVAVRNSVHTCHCAPRSLRSASRWEAMRPVTSRPSTSHSERSSARHSVARSAPAARSAAEPRAGTESACACTRSSCSRRRATTASSTGAAWLQRTRCALSRLSDTRTRSASAIALREGMLRGGGGMRRTLAAASRCWRGCQRRVVWPTLTVSPGLSLYGSEARLGSERRLSFR
mmetsp:Transcript_22231/g.65533  ORF Transcript_22231/g.65533 Transcript_22231/m.65533 type:complete len:286 (+) Transcript_22231:625-1482(+)